MQRTALYVVYAGTVVRNKPCNAKLKTKHLENEFRILVKKWALENRMSYPYVDILTAPYVYYASFNAVECFKMHCNVSQKLVTHLQRFP